MRRAIKVLVGACVGCCLFAGRNAGATTELPAQYDARSVAMGGTGSSFIENGASVYHNPATLDGIKTFSGTVALSPFRLVLTSPLMGPETSVDSKGSISPLFLVGAGLRVHERVVVGLAVYPTVGVGSTYDTPGGEASLAVMQGEVAPSVSFKIIDGLSIGLGYRLTYTQETVKQPATAPGGPTTEISMNGMNYFGIHAGVYYRPIENLHLAFTYRSRVDTTLKGDTEVGPTKFHTESSFNAPHRFRLGVSGSVLDKRLLLAADLKYLLYESSNRSTDTTITTPAGPVTTTQPLGWKNVLAAAGGAELWAIPMFAVRAGYSVSQSATPDNNAGPFTLPPGILHTIHAGVGLRITNLDLDLGGFYSFSSKHEDATPASADSTGVTPGDYKMQTIMGSLSATYHM